MSKEEIKITVSKEELEVMLVGVGEMIANFADKDYSEELELTIEEYFKFLSNIKPTYDKIAEVYNGIGK
jgi:hypothetical protein